MEVDETGALPNRATSAADAAALAAHVVGSVIVGEAGPFGEEFPDFANDNIAIRLKKGDNYLRVTDPGQNSSLDFDNGDEITLEAWIRPAPNPRPSYSYIVGKGRTHSRGFSSRNQNYSMRLANTKDSARLSFFFVDAETPPSDLGRTDDGHRWTSNRSLLLDSRWHHVAVTYKFGDPGSLKGYIDGEETSGKWDLAGATDKRPVVDDDELWIGSSLSGQATFPGGIDEVAVYRRALSAESVARHVHIHRRDEVFEMVRDVANIAPDDHVQYDVYEGLAAAESWNVVPLDGQTVYASDVFALTELPLKYDDRGLIADRAGPILVHGYARLVLPEGEQQLLLRSLNAARLYVDGELLAENPFLPTRADGHGKVYVLEGSPQDRVSLPAGHNETVISYVSDGKPHVFSLVAMAGFKGRPAELGELVVAWARQNESFQLLGSRGDGSDDDQVASSYEHERPDRAFNDEGWLAFLERDHSRRWEWEARTRHVRSAAEDAYWQERHRWVKERQSNLPRVEIPSVADDQRVNNPIDRFIQNRLEEEKIEPMDSVDDLSFLRRVTLDTTGRIPTPEEIDRFLSEPAGDRRRLVIDRLLEDPGWADHWVGYWQHVLAENPGLTKPTLNNSGPFRWFLYEAFLDNKSFDRIVTELISMEGGRQSGGPGGFALATNNDVPMAQKAHIVATAFLGVEMKCARCHDAPLHESTQQDLFSLAAMLGREPLAVPSSSTVPATPEQLEHMAVTVSLKPGVPVPPAWPFDDLASGQLNDVPSQLVRTPKDSRAVLAWSITQPGNERFAQVIVNRLWKRYLGRGIVEPVQDWETGEPSHPALLAFLADELILNRYDLKHVARLILNSQAYQREVDESDLRDARNRLFAAPTRRRMTAEQLADSLFLAVGKPFDSEELCLNADGKQVAVNFLNLGVPRRAWQFACTSNERERPSMTLPRAQSVVDLMMAYGWRQNRQEPVNERISETTPLSPLELANGVAASRAVDLADDGCLVDLCLEDQPVERLVDRLFLRFLSRPPSDEERDRYVSLLSEGYADRATGEPRMPRKVDRSPLAWSNNLDADANRIGEERQRLALEGDSPTRRLTSDWRERVEDMVWVIVNSPEFVFVP